MIVHPKMDEYNINRLRTDFFDVIKEVDALYDNKKKYIISSTLLTPDLSPSKIYIKLHTHDRVYNIRTKAVHAAITVNGRIKSNVIGHCCLNRVNHDETSIYTDLSKKVLKDHYNIDLTNKFFYVNNTNDTQFNIDGNVIFVHPVLWDSSVLLDNNAKKYLKKYIFPIFKELLTVISNEKYLYLLKEHINEINEKTFGLDYDEVFSFKKDQETRRIITRIESHYREIIQLRAKLRALELPGEKPTIDISQLRRLVPKLYKSFSVDGSVIKAITSPITIGKLHMGCYVVEIDLEQDHYFVYQHQDIERQYVHPHVNRSSNACLGNIGNFLPKLFANGQFILGFTVIHQYLRSYNPADSYWRISASTPDMWSYDQNKPLTKRHYGVPSRVVCDVCLSEYLLGNLTVCDKCNYRLCPRCYEYNHRACDHNENTCHISVTCYDCGRIVVICEYCQDTNSCPDCGIKINSTTCNWENTSEPCVQHGLRSRFKDVETLLQTIYKSNTGKEYQEPDETSAENSREVVPESVQLSEQVQQQIQLHDVQREERPSD